VKEKPSDAKARESRVRSTLRRFGLLVRKNRITGRYALLEMDMTLDAGCSDLTLEDLEETALDLRRDHWDAR
jgi:hypothetical protein